MRYSVFADLALTFLFILALPVLAVLALLVLFFATLCDLIMILKVLLTRNREPLSCRDQQTCLPSTNATSAGTESQSGL